MKIKILKRLLWEFKYSKIFFRLKKQAFVNSYLLKIVLNILAFTFLLYGRNLYIKSLIGCDGDEFKCIIRNKLDYILDDIYYCTHSALYFLIFLLILHLKLCSFYQLFIFILKLYISN